jgi:hypothetical protein
MTATAHGASCGSGSATQAKRIEVIFGWTNSGIDFER